MASFRRIEIWTDYECNAGVRVAEFGPSQLAKAVLTQSLTNVEQLQFTVSRTAPDTAQLIAARIARVCMSDSTLDTEWKLSDDLTQSGTGDQGQLAWTAYAPIVDLGRAPYVAWDALGAVITSFSAVQLSASAWITGFVLPAIAESAPFPAAVGTVVPTNAFDLAGDYQTAGQILAALVAPGNAAGDVYLTKNGATNYLINVGTRGGAAETVRVQAARNLLSNVRKRQLAVVAPKIMPRGDPTSICRDMGRAYWLVTATTLTTATLVDPLGGAGPCAFTGQLNGLYATQVGGFGISALVTASTTAGVITALAIAFSIGDIIEFRRTTSATGKRLPFLQHPTAALSPHAGGYGARTLVLDVSGVVGDSNLLSNPWARQYSGTGFPTGWTGNTAGLAGVAELTLTRFGGQAYRWAGPSNAAGWTYSAMFPPLLAGAHIYCAHIWIWVVTNVDANFVLRIADGSTLASIVDAPVGAIPTGQWFKASIVGLSLAGATNGIRVALLPMGGATGGTSLDYIIDAFSFSESDADIADVESSGGTTLWQTANTRLAVSASLIGAYTLGLADLARMDNSAWSDEPLVTGGLVEIIDGDIPDATTQRITDLQQDLLNPLSSTVQLASPNPLITSLLAASGSGSWTTQADAIRRVAPQAATLGLTDAGPLGTPDPRYAQLKEANEFASTVTVDGALSLSEGLVIESNTGIATMAANGQASVGAQTASGLVMNGRGATQDFVLFNKSGAAVIEVPTGSTTVALQGDLTVAGTLHAPSVNDASALPTVAGAAGTLWVDTAGGFNIVKRA